MISELTVSVCVCACVCFRVRNAPLPVKVCCSAVQLYMRGKPKSVTLETKAGQAHADFRKNRDGFTLLIPSNWNSHHQLPQAHSNLDLKVCWFSCSWKRSFNLIGWKCKTNALMVGVGTTHYGRDYSHWPLYVFCHYVWFRCSQV